MQRQSSCSIGAVSFLNTKPLIEGLDELPGISLRLAVPAKLPALLESGQVDVALVPAFDFGCNRDEWQLVSDGCIASDGQTMTVRIFSRVPPDRITVLHVDSHSHTSVALTRVLWSRLFKAPVQMQRIDADGESLDNYESVLLIGDKVVSDMTRQFGYEMDLGAAWKQLTGLPFVFAVWTARKGFDTESIGKILGAARDRGVARAAELASEYGPDLGWPPELAARYLTKYLSYTLTPQHRQGLELFLQLAGELNLLRPDDQSEASSAEATADSSQGVRADLG
jgi:chorismate dehydratase